MSIHNNKQFLIKTFVIIGFWIFLAFISVLQIFPERKLLEQYSSWNKIVIGNSVRWLVWIVFTPLVLWLSDTFPLERTRWKRSIVIHFFSSILVSAICSGLSELWLIRVGPAASSGSVPVIYKYLRANQIFFYWGLVGIGHSIKYYSLLREREMHSLRLEKELSDAKLYFLNSQLHPHFLFNTMHTIANLIRDKSYHAAIETISGFSELLRLSLANLNAQFVSLKEEIDYLDLYLNIEKVRFKDRLSTAVEIPPEVLSCNVPFLLLQPFIENSIKHGLSKHEDSQLIRVSASRHNQRLVLMIEDDGPGLPDAWSLEECSGIGLQNIHRRLAAIYGSDFTMELQNRDPSGVTVTIIIPFSKKTE